MLRDVISAHLRIADLCSIVLDFLAFEGKRLWSIDGCLGTVAASLDGGIVFSNQAGIGSASSAGVASALTKDTRVTKIACVGHLVVSSRALSGLIRVHDRAGKLLRKMQHADIISSIVPLTNNRFATVGVCHVMVWDALTGKKLVEIREQRKAHVLVPLHHGFVFDCGHAIQICNARGQLVHEVSTESEIFELCVFGTKIAAKVSRGVDVWEATTGRLVGSIGPWANAITTWQDMLVVAYAGKETSLDFYDHSLHRKRQVVLPIEVFSMAPLGDDRLVVLQYPFNFVSVYE